MLSDSPDSWEIMGDPQEIRDRSPNRGLRAVRELPRPMPRAARVVAIGAPHYLTQRGNNRLDIFLVDADRRTYLERRQDRLQCGVRLLGWCLMTNHVLLIACCLKLCSIADVTSAINSAA